MTKRLKAEKVNDRWEVEGETKHLFIEILAGIGYGSASEAGDYRMDAAVVVGLHEDGRFIVLDELLENNYWFGKKLVDLKDRFLIKHFILDGTLDWRRQILSREDGLCKYELDPKKDQQPIAAFLHPPDTWPHFRDRKTLAILHAVPDDILDEPMTAIGKVYGLMISEDLVVTPHCHKTKLLTRESSAEGQQHPLLLALVFAVMTLWHRHQYDNVFKTKTPLDYWYSGRWDKPSTPKKD